MQKDNILTSRFGQALFQFGLALFMIAIGFIWLACGYVGAGVIEIVSASVPMFFGFLAVFDR